MAMRWANKVNESNFVKNIIMLKEYHCGDYYLETFICYGWYLTVLGWGHEMLKLLELLLLLCYRKENKKLLRENSICNMFITILIKILIKLIFVFCKKFIVNT